MTCSLVIKIRTTGIFFQSFTHSCLVFSLQWKEMLDQGLIAVVRDLCCLFLLSLSPLHSLTCHCFLVKQNDIKKIKIK